MVAFYKSVRTTAAVAQIIFSSSSVLPASPAASTDVFVPPVAPSSAAVPDPVVVDSSSAVIPEPAATSTASASQADALSGKATFYGGNLDGGNCMFTGYTLPSGVFGTALSNVNWDSSGNCGACLSVSGPKGSITVMVVDKCPECVPNGLDLFEDAFPNIGNPSDGIVPISWSVVPCGISTPLKVRNKSGTSKYWFSMQVYNANNVVTALDVSTDGGSSWSPTVRQDYNYFQKSSGDGFGADTVTVRVTCANGQQVVLSNVGVSSSTEYTASGNC